MFEFGARKAAQPQIDLQTVRETLLYIESDCRDRPGMERLAKALAETISEIDRVSARLDPAPRGEVISARFLPAGL